MNILIQLGHPAHFHLYKNAILLLQSRGHNIHVLIKTKDILENLCIASGIKYINILPEGRKDSKFGVFIGMLKRDWRIFNYVRKHDIDLMTGSAVEIAHVGKILKKPSIFMGEDDAAIIKPLCLMTFPFITEIVQPVVCDAGRWDKRAIKYSGYQKLAYLHPNRFTPSKDLIPEINFDKPYFIIRLVSLGAYHDANKHGVSGSVLNELIEKLSFHGTVYISSENKLPENLQKYLLPIADLSLIHHALFYASLYIGDSQSMAVESAVLGVPNIRYNDFIGQIGVLEELEHVYGLTKGIPTKDKEQLFLYIDNILSNPNSKKEFQQKRHKMLEDKIDVTAFMVWLFENYPESSRIMKQNPNYQLQFK